MQNTGSTNRLAFMKMHGLGNDFVIFDSRGKTAVTTPDLARAIGNRNTGVGFDQLAEIRSGEDTDIILDFWNSDGSVAGACGNATRCVAQYILAESSAESLTIRTLRGVLQARRAEGGMISVNMGIPQTDWQDIHLSHEVDTNCLPLEGEPVAVGIGNPHCVFFVDDALAVDVAREGAAVEHHALFTKGTNVEFAEIRSRQEIRMRVWERGAGITLACGSGACATAVAANLRGLVDKSIRIEVDGGWLTLDWREDGVWMTGPTAHVFSGVFESSFLDSI